jgi:hypothetical protein
MDIFELLGTAPPTDPFSDTTRGHRRSLLVACLISFAVTAGGLVPMEISALGVKLSAGEWAGLLILLGLVVVYFLAAFLTYAIPEWQRFNAMQRVFRQRIAELIKLEADLAPDYRIELKRLEKVVHTAAQVKLAGVFLGGRAALLAFDLFLPVALFVVAEILILSAAFALPVFSLSAWKSSPGVLGTALVLVISSVLLVLRARQRWKEKRPLHAMEKIGSEMADLMEQMRAAQRLPEGSLEREEAKRRIEEKLRELGKQQAPTRMEPP